MSKPKFLISLELLASTFQDQHFECDYKVIYYISKIINEKVNIMHISIDAM